MKTTRIRRSVAVALALCLVPVLGLAEVSVQLDHQGRFKRLLYLTKGSGSSRVVWSQVRRGLPLERMLNPLGDNLGDSPPRIAFNPLTGAPWVFWSMNIANQKRIGYAYWNGAGWTKPVPIVASAGPYYYDQLDPAVVFFLGTPYVVWWQAEPIAKVYFSILVGGVWTPPVLISDPLIDSRKPIVTLSGGQVTVAYETPVRATATTYDGTALYQAAASLMDTPIPPGQSDDPDPATPGPGGKQPPHSRQ